MLKKPPVKFSCLLLTSLLGCVSAADMVVSPEDIAKLKERTPKPQKAASVAPNIKTVIRAYNEASSVQMAVKKTVYMALMGDTKTSEGEAIYSKGRLKLEMGEPENSLIVMDRSVIWVVSPGIEKDKPQVLKITAKDMRNQSRAPLALLLSKEQAWDNFKTLRTTAIDAGTRVELAPIDPKKWPDLQKISLTIGKDGKSLVQISYEDELENRTEFAFSDIKKDQKLPARTFAYSPPPGAEITVYE